MKNTIYVIKRVMNLCKEYIFQIITIVFLLVITTVVSLIPTIVIKNILDLFISTEFNGNGLLLLIAALFIIPMLNASIQMIQYSLSTKISFKMMMDIKEKMISRVLHSKLSALSVKNTGEWGNRITTEASSVQSVFEGLIIPFFMLVISMITTLWLALSLNWTLTLISLLLYPVTLFPSNYFAKKRQKLSNIIKDKNEHLSGYTNDIFRGLKNVRQFSMEEHETSEIKKLDSDIVNDLSKNNLYSWMNNLIFNNMISGLVSATTYGIGIYLIVYSDFTIGGLIAFTSILPSIYAVITQFTRLNGAIKMQSSSLERLDEVLNLPIEESGENSISNYDISFDNVCFKYDMTSPFGLYDFSLNIEQNSFIGIAGSSGAGKSTIFELLMKYRIPDRGKIQIGGIGIDTINNENLRRNISVVSQDIYLFNRSIYENITYGTGTENISDDDLDTACKKANIYNFIQALPNKYETVISESSQNISGGERVRLAVARALLRKSPILLFDETTAALDAINEKMFTEIIDELKASHTIICIAHRLTSIKNADKIIVISEGRLKEEGTHDKLIQENGLYRSMWNTYSN